MQKRDRNLYFVGIKHSGKTTFARRVADRLTLAFSDADDLILSSISPLSVREYYRDKGKQEFMKAEYEAVSAFIDHTKERVVLSLGGGASDNLPLMEKLKESGEIIYLKRKEEDILPVILRNGIPPFLDKDDVEGSFHALYERRSAIYESYSSLSIDLGEYGDKDKTEEMILSTLKENAYV